MRVVVTGGSGRAGSYTVRELAAAGHEVINLDMARPPADLPGAFVQLDLTDAGEVYDVLAQFRPEGVCHLAANPSPTGFPRHQTFDNNVLSTNNVMQAAGDVGRIAPGVREQRDGDGVADDGRAAAAVPVRRDGPGGSPSAYALSKYMGEVIADSMVRQYPAMSICSLRINNVIMPDGYDVLQYRRDHFPEGGVNFWSYIDARDVASAFRAALEGDIEGHEVFLIAAADTCLDTPIQEAVERLYGPGARFAPDHGPFDSVFSCRRIEERLGVEAAALLARRLNRRPRGSRANARRPPPGTGVHQARPARAWPSPADAGDAGPYAPGGAYDGRVLLTASISAGVSKTVVTKRDSAPDSATAVARAAAATASGRSPMATKSHSPKAK
jgi:nucleoside-diphosphate-sugar epimerase